MVDQCAADDPRWAELVRRYHGIVGTLVRLATERPEVAEAMSLSARVAYVCFGG
jgi:hypothetical protein